MFLYKLTLSLFFLLMMIHPSVVNTRLENYEETVLGDQKLIKMRAIAPGSYAMGSMGEGLQNKGVQSPQHEVYVDAFWMSEKEISWEIYQEFLYREKNHIRADDYGDLVLDIDGLSAATMPYVNFNITSHPVIDVTQYAASMFCKWLSAKTGRFYRLPTEAEWEYACRAGTTAPYSFDSNLIDEYAWYADNSQGTFHPSGLKKPNSFGLYDMHGNVAEWVLDHYDPKGYDAASDSGHFFLRKESLYPRVFRGGSWRDPKEVLRSSERNHSSPKLKQRDPQLPKSLWWHTDAPHIGFRVVRSNKILNLDEMNLYWGKPIREY